jgi:hypothetical protein
MLTSYFTVKPVASVPKKAVKKIVPPSPAPPSPSPSPAVDAVYMNTDAIDDDVSVVDSLDGDGEVLETPISDCADKDFPETLSDVSDADVAAAVDIDDDDIFTLLRTQSRRSIDQMSGPELCCDDEDF